MKFGSRDGTMTTDAADADGRTDIKVEIFTYVDLLVFNEYNTIFITACYLLQKYFSNSKVEKTKIKSAHRTILVYSFYSNN